MFDKMTMKDVASCKSIHSYGVRRCIFGVAPNSLPDMYSKCGEENLAHRIFHWMRVNNDVPWVTRMAGYVQHGGGGAEGVIFQVMEII